MLKIVLVTRRFPQFFYEKKDFYFQNAAIFSKVNTATFLFIYFYIENRNIYFLFRLKTSGLMQLAVEPFEKNGLFSSSHNTLIS